MRRAAILAVLGGVAKQFAVILTVIVLSMTAPARAQPIASEVTRLLPVCIEGLTRGFESADTLVAQGYRLDRARETLREYSARFGSTGGVVRAQVFRRAELQLRAIPRRGRLECTITIQSEDESQRFAELVSAGFRDLGFRSDGAGAQVRGDTRIAVQMGLFGTRTNPEMMLFLTQRREG